MSSPLRVRREWSSVAADQYSRNNPDVLTVYCTATEAGSYYNGVPCGIPYRGHEWLQGLINGRPVWTPPPDLLTWWEGEPNNSVSVLSVRVPHNQPVEEQSDEHVMPLEDEEEENDA